MQIITISLVLCTLLSIFSNAYAKDEWEITPFASYRFGGDFDDEVNDFSLDLDDHSGLGAVLTWHFDKGRQGELLFSHNNTTLQSDDPLIDIKSDIEISYLHLGGNVKLNDGVVPFWLSGGIGMTYLSPDDNTLDDETQFSGNLGLNTRFELTKSLSLRIDGRIYGTFFDTDSAIFCNSDDCKIFVEGEVWVQSELSAGLTFKF